MVLQELVTLFVFVFVLSKSSSLVVENAVKLAKFFGISQLAIGLLLIAVATSLPELSVSVVSSVANEGAIAAGNVFGSNIANILLVLGIGAIVYGFKVSRKNLSDIAIALVLTTLISTYILFHSQISGNALGFYEGLLLLAIAIWYAFRVLGKKRIEEMPEKGKISMHEGFRAFLFFAAGIVLVMVSSNFVVSSAVKLSDLLGLTKSFIGATLIAIGTSLPELSIDLQALRKKQYGLALGDALGSNIINLTLVLGTAALISPITVQLKVFVAALLFAVVANMVFLYISVVKGKFERKDGAIMVVFYVIYLALIFFLQIGEAQFA